MLCISTAAQGQSITIQCFGGLYGTGSLVVTPKCVGVQGVHEIIIDIVLPWFIIAITNKDCNVCV